MTISRSFGRNLILAPKIQRRRRQLPPPQHFYEVLFDCIKIFCYEKEDGAIKFVYKECLGCTFDISKKDYSEGETPASRAFPFYYVVRAWVRIPLSSLSFLHCAGCSFCIFVVVQVYWGGSVVRGAFCLFFSNPTPSFGKRGVATARTLL